VLSWTIVVVLGACGQSGAGSGNSGGTMSGTGGHGGSGSGGTADTGGAGSGGTTASGGSVGAGGSQGSGGTTSLGGTTATGGASAGGAGGTAASGGRTGSGGVSGVGGSNTGGRTAATGGAASGGMATGGATGGGGASGAGGTTRTTVGTGGATDGGTTGAGGRTGTGGTTGSGGGTGSDSDSATIVPDPSWTCGMADGIPPPAAGTLAFSVSLTVSATHDVGNTQFGKRRQLDVSGGTITGDKLKGTVLTGGLDYELTLSTGAMELEEILIFKTSDNINIFVRNCGVAAAGDAVIRIVPDIEAPTSGSYAWLNTTKLVGTRVVNGSKIQLDVYDVSQVSAGEPKVQLKDPAGVPNVSWDCVGGSGSKGATVFTENVTLGSSFTISNAKRGSRNVIPITGGTTTGKVAGSILNGGADYQLAGTSGTTLDARYTLAPSDGELIIVRNCGPMNSLVPVFEARADGPYGFLTTGKFLSSAPGAGSGGVSITFYERN
jgi:hypothetical protein